MKNKFNDTPKKIIILNEEVTSPKENNMLKYLKIKWHKFNDYIKKHNKVLSIYIALIGVLLPVLFWIFDSSKVNEHTEVVNNSHIEIENSRSVAVNSPGAEIHISIKKDANVRLPFYSPRILALEKTNESNALNPLSLFIPLIGRNEEMDSLKTFLLSSDDLMIRVITGSSGSDKERLAINLCLEAQKLDPQWETAYMTADDLEELNKISFSQLRWGYPTLLVINNAMPYRDTIRQMLRGFINNKDAKNPPLRILLLAQSAEIGEGWWGELFGRYNLALDGIFIHEILNPVEPVELHPLKINARIELLQETLKRSESRIEIIDTPELRENISNIEWSGEPLFLVIAALRMKEIGMSEVLTLKRIDLFQWFIDSLSIQLKETAKAEKIPESLLKHMVACLALTRGMGRQEFIKFCIEEKIIIGWDSGDPVHIANALSYFFPSDTPEDKSIGYPFPLLLSESFFLNDLKKDKGETAWRCYKASGKVVLSSIISCIQNYAPDNKDTEYLMLAWLERIYDGIKNDVNKLEEFSYLLPQESIILQSFSVKLMAELVELKKKTSPDELDKIATYVNDYAIRLSNNGQREEALKYAHEAADIYRELVILNRDVYLPYLAMSINNLACDLNDSGKSKEDAFKYAQEAVDIYQELIELNKYAYLPDFAMSINNLANRLSDRGQGKKALEYAQKAIDIRGELVELNRDANLPDLALSLSNFAKLLSDSGQGKKAIEYAQKAVDIRRELVELNRDAHLPNLASSIDNLANRLSESGLREKALKCIQEAVDIRRGLVELNRDTYLPDLAMSVLNYSLHLKITNDNNGALEKAKAAFDLYKELLKKHETAFFKDFQKSARNYIDCLSKVGREEEAAKLRSEIEKMLEKIKNDAGGEILNYELSEIIKIAC